MISFNEPKCDLCLLGVQEDPRKNANGSYCGILDIARGEINIEAFCKSCEVSAVT